MSSHFKNLVLSVAAVALVLMASACRNANDTLEKPSLNLQTTRLAIIPEGYEAVEFYFSEDGRRVAYAVRKDGKLFLVSDGKESLRYDDLHRVVFSPDGKSVAFRRMDKSGESVVINGKEEKKYQSIGGIQFAPDGRIVYEAMQKNKWMVVSGRREGPVFDMPYSAPVIRPDRQIMTYVEQDYSKKKSNITVCNLDLTKCAKGKDYDFIITARNNASASRFAYIVGSNGKMTVVTADISDTAGVNEKECPFYDKVYTVDLSPDGNHLAYLAQRGKSIFLVKDGVEMPFPEHDMRSHLIVAKNGRTYNTGMFKDRFFAIVDGEKTGKTYDEITEPAFSPDGTRLAYAARRGGEWFVVVNGVEGTSFDKVVAPLFSPDGIRLVYRVRDQEKRYVVVADANGRILQKQKHYELIWAPVFSSDGKSVAYGVKTGRELWWKVEQIN